MDAAVGRKTVRKLFLKLSEEQNSRAGKEGPLAEGKGLTA
jgi:hypothetical protein